ncbi:hypothetical protein QBC32DRAFT_207155 [Pseudoneurospora amorphoporcata]|uniref:SWIM-type domain-containing protein n=1 Tax=Pseudoneurospora amorphoporcata TaxID=241081 RepID=A0AAN6P110_9PEZI|nr:hypothetical protein QBC32DRAFT_207155 [Pseudoneurospora amorphoporcata]
MTSPNPRHGHHDPDSDFHLHPPASHQPQRSYQPQQLPEAESPSLLSQSDSPQTSTPLHLPTSRQFLTSLITAISNIPLLDEPPTQVCKPAESPTDEKEGAAAAETDTSRRKQLLQILKEEGQGTEHIIKKRNGGGDVNPLKLVPPEYRHLIITLHVLFPEVVLPGLEVLERGLVERVALRCAGEAAVVKKEGQERHQKGQKEQAKEEDVTMREDDDYGHEDQDNNEETKLSNRPEKGQEKRPPGFYLVRSSRFLNTHPRRKRKKSNMGLGDVDVESTGGGETDRHQIQRYLVSLEAWNCTCAAFAFACVSEFDKDSFEPPRARKRAKEREADKKGTVGWTFGGMILFDAEDYSSVPPVCKHLLACLLADKWREALGRYVTERLVSREEMAGMVADV